MAANFIPIQHNTIVRRCDTREINRGYAFDAPQARQAPRAPWTHPSMRADSPWIGAPPLFAIGPAPTGNCSDRLNHMSNPASNNHPCSSLLNPNPAPAPALQPPRGFQQEGCVDVAKPHGGNFWTCGYCRENTREQAWYRWIEHEITKPPPPIPRPVDVDRNGEVPEEQSLMPRWDPTDTIIECPATKQFLTYLCIECERAEQLLLHHRRENEIEAIELKPKDYQLMRPVDGWPDNTCSCRGWLEGPFGLPLCLECTHYWGCKHHDQRLIMRQQNDRWLRETRRNKITGSLERAPDWLIRRREKYGTWRACRCGAEIKRRPYNRPNEVLQCLGCEGIVHIGAYAHTFPAVPPPAVANAGMATRNGEVARLGERDYSLRRPY